MVVVVVGTRAPHTVTSNTDSRRHLDFNFHLRVSQPGKKHRASGSRRAQILPENGPARLKIRPLRQNIMNAHHLPKPATSLCQRRRDIHKTLLSLHNHIIGNRHRPVIITGSARHKNIIPIHHRPRIPDILFKVGTS